MWDTVPFVHPKIETKGGDMSCSIEGRLPGLSLLLCAQTNEYGRAVIRVFVGHLDRMYRNCLRHSFVSRQR